MYLIAINVAGGGRQFWNGVDWVDDPSKCGHTNLQLAREERANRAGHAGFIVDDPGGRPITETYGGSSGQKQLF